MFGDAEMQPNDGPESIEDIAAELEGEAEEIDESEAEEESDEIEGQEADESDEEEGEEVDGDTEDDEDETTVTLKHDGKEVSLKLSEVKELAQKGFDYTTKTMAVAEERKAVEAERSKASELRQQREAVVNDTIHRLNAYAQFIEAQVGQPPPVSLAQQDAARYLAEKEMYEARKGQYQQALSEAQRLEDELARERQAEIAQKAESAEKALRDTLPGWSDAMLDDLAAYARQFGLDGSTVDKGVLEPGYWQVLHKAKAFDALQEQKSRIKPEKKAPKVNKPSSGNNHPKRSELRKAEAAKRYDAKPSLDNLAALID